MASLTGRRSRGNSPRFATRTRNGVSSRGRFGRRASAPRARLVRQRTIFARAPSRKNSGDPFSGIFSSLISIISRPEVLLSIVIATALVLNHQSQGVDSVIQTVARSFGTSSALGRWINDNLPKVVGWLVFGPVIVASPVRMRFLVLLATGVWALCTPATSIAIYFVEALILYLFIKVNDRNTKLLLIFAASLLLIYNDRLDSLAPTEPSA